MKEESNDQNNQNRGNLPVNFFRDKNITTDPQAPVIYSRYTLRFFTILCSTFVGGILLAINFQRLNKRTQVLQVLLFSFLYTLGEAALFTHFGPHFTNLIFIFNLIGSAILEELFWNRFIGKNFRYRRRQIWPLVALMLAITLLVLLASQ